MASKLRPNGYWNKKRISIEAKKYLTKKEFNKNCTGAFQAAVRLGILNKVCSHMKVIVRSPKYYTLKLLRECISYCNNSIEFRKKYSREYDWAKEHGYLKKIGYYKISIRDRNVNKENLRKLALKYKTRKAFSKAYPNERMKIYNRGWHDELFSHMRKSVNKNNRCVYVFEFPDDHCYIGITDEPKRRKQQHISEDISKKSPVKNHIKKTGLQPEFKLLTSFFTYDKVKSKEGWWQNKYKRTGWIALHKAKPGALGGGIRFEITNEEIKKIAFKYKYKSDFKENEPTLYEKVRRKPIYKKIVSHMIGTRPHSEDAKRRNSIRVKKLWKTLWINKTKKIKK